MYRAPLIAGPRLRECCRQVEAEMVSKSKNKIHQTLGSPISGTLSMHRIPKKDFAYVVWPCFKFRITSDYIDHGQQKDFLLFWSRSIWIPEGGSTTEWYFQRLWTIISGLHCITNCLLTYIYLRFLTHISYNILSYRGWEWMFLHTEMS